MATSLSRGPADGDLSEEEWLAGLAAIALFLEKEARPPSPSPWRALLRPPLPQPTLWRSLAWGPRERRR